MSVDCFFFVFKEIEVYSGFSISNVKAGENVCILDVTLVQSSCTRFNSSIKHVKCTFKCYIINCMFKSAFS